jgi:hypothetical protein
VAVSITWALRAVDADTTSRVPSGDIAIGPSGNPRPECAAGIGHDACQLPLIRWVEPAVPANAAAPFHPNLFGMEDTARALLAAAPGR